jgi:Secretion system C-terminal sorting domain
LQGNVKNIVTVFYLLTSKTFKMLQLFNKTGKTLFLLFTLSLSLAMANAQLARLSQRPPTNGQGGWSTNNFSICSPANRDWRVEYNFCAPVPNGPCTISGACGANPYRIHFRLFRNGNQIANTTYQLSQAWGNWPLYNFATQPGNYQAEIRLQVRRWPFCTWSTLQTTLTNTITVSAQQAIPDFNINGIPIPSNGSPILVCGSNIRVNAANTSCETRYLVSIQESDRWWNRTGQYEVDVWFNGQAPNNINLQQLAINNSQPPTFIGPVNRRNTGLFGGNLPNGQKRYYRVSICVNEPNWVCKTALIEVDGNCRTDQRGEPDNNIYDMIGSGNEGGDMANLEYDPIIKGNGDVTNTDMEIAPCTDDFVDNTGGKIAPTATNLTAIPTTKAQSDASNSITTAKLAPNPASDQVSLAITLQQESLVQVNIFNAAGNRVKQALSNRKLMPGQQNLPLDISGLTSGIYIVEIWQDKQVSKQKLVINK